MQTKNTQAKAIKTELKKGWEDINDILYDVVFLYALKLIQAKFISRHQNNCLVSYLKIKKTRKLVDQKYYWETSRPNVKTYIKKSKGCLVSKIVKHKPYKNL